MVLIRPAPWHKCFSVLIASIAVGVATYALTNPYVVINGLTNRAALLSNLRNSTAMYTAGRWNEGMGNAIYLLAEAASPVVAVVAVLASGALLALKSDRIRDGLT